jgi:hypothetical protein
LKPGSGPEIPALPDGPSLSRGRFPGDPETAVLDSGLRCGIIFEIFS